MRGTTALLVVLLLAGCVRPPVATKPKTAATPKPAASVPLPTNGTPVVANNGGSAPVIANNGAGLAGEVLAPAGIVANNGRSIVTDNGSGRRLLATPDQRPLANVTVRLDGLKDANGQPFIAKTDAAGHYSFPTVPANTHLVLVVDLGTAGKLEAIAPKDRDVAAKVNLDVVSTLTTAYILDQYVQGNPAVLDKLPAAVEADTRAKAAAALTAVPDALTTAKVVAAVEALRKADKALDAELEVVKRLLVVGGVASQTDGNALMASLNQPKGMDVAADGTLYFVDSRNNLIRSLSPQGQIATIAGSGSAANQDGDGLAAGFQQPFGLALDGRGGLYVSCVGHVLRRVDLLDARHPVRTIVGTGARGTKDGPGATATLFNPLGLACDRRDPAHPVLYVVDGTVSTVRRVDLADPAYPITTIAGSGKSGRVDGAGTQAAFALPQGAVVSPDGTLYVADSGNHQIRAVALDGTVTTIAGTGTAGAADGPGDAASFNLPTSVAYVSGALLVTDLQNHLVRRIDLATRQVTTLAGQATPGRLDGVGTAASFLKPQGIAAAGGTAWVADTFNHLIRRVDVATRQVLTVAGLPAGANVDGTSTAALFSNPRGLCIAKDGTIYVADTEHHTIRAVAKDGTVTTIAGSGDGTFLDGQGTQAAFWMPYNLVLDRDQTGLIVADSFNHRIRRVDLATKQVTTLAGTGQPGLVDGPGASAAFNTPVGLALDPKGLLYVGDAKNFGIRAVDLADPAHPVSSIAGAGKVGTADGPGASAGFNLTYGLALGDGVLYVADTYNNRIRQVDLVDPAHPVTTLAGQTKSGRADGPGLSASFFTPQGLVLDAAGDLWVGDTANSLIRKISLGVPDHPVTTVAGTGEKGFAEGQGLTAQFAKPTGLALDPAGDVWVTDTENQRVRNVGH